MLTGALPRARDKPKQQFSLGIAHEACSGRAIVARTITPEPVLVNGVGMDAKKIGDLFRVEGAPLGRIAEQLRKLLEGHVDCVHHSSPIPP